MRGTSLVTNVFTSWTCTTGGSIPTTDKQKVNHLLTIILILLKSRYCLKSCEMNSFSCVENNLVYIHPIILALDAISYKVELDVHTRDNEYLDHLNRWVWL